MSNLRNQVERAERRRRHFEYHAVQLADSFIEKRTTPRTSPRTPEEIVQEAQEAR